MSFQYVGGHQIVFLIKSKEWPVSKIYCLAKLHSHIVHDLKPRFVHNIKDLRNKIGSTLTLCQGFYGMLAKESSGKENPFPLLDSIHNTNAPHTKVALASADHFDEAVTQ